MGLVFYDLKKCLRDAGEVKPKPEKPKRKPATGSTTRKKPAPSSRTKDDAGS